MPTLIENKPFKIVRDRRLSYLRGLEEFYTSEGYATRLLANFGTLEVYPKGAIVPKTAEELVVEKWID